MLDLFLQGLNVYSILPLDTSDGPRDAMNIIVWHNAFEAETIFGVPFHLHQLG